MSKVIKDIFLNQPNRQAVFTKVIRYLRYYPVDLGSMVYFLIQHNLSSLFTQDKSNKTFVQNGAYLGVVGPVADKKKGMG